MRLTELVATSYIYGRTFLWISFLLLFSRIPSKIGEEVRNRKRERRTDNSKKQMLDSLR